MLTKMISGVGVLLGAPKDWNLARDGECGVLPIRVHGRRGQGDTYCESAWEPTPRELEQLNAGGQVVLRVYGWQVPVALSVEAPPTDYEDVHTSEQAA